MGVLLILVGLAGFIFSLVNVVRPLGRLRIETRKQAAIAVGASFVVMMIGSAISPAEDADPVPLAAVDTTVPSSTATTTTELTTTVPEATTSTAVTTTSTTSSRSSTRTSSAPPPPSTRERGALVLDLHMTIPIELETQSGYDRGLFEVWSDLDGDGCDARQEVLIRDAVDGPTVGSGCDVGGGLWYSIYDGVWLDHGDQLNVDHVVALKEAWDSGAKDWDSARRVAFGNDIASPLTLVAVSSSSNQEKGDADPSNWLPANEDDVCRYVTAWVVIKAEWGLSMDESEHGRIRNLLQGPCQGATVGDAVPVWPAVPATTTTSSTPTTVVEGTTDVVIANIVYDAPGNDVVFNDSEYVVLKNNGTGTADVGGWSLEDEANHLITIPSDYRIQPGKELRVYTGPGDDTASSYFAGFGQAIWNNSGGDTATLRNASGETIDTFSYSS